MASERPLGFRELLALGLNSVVGSSIFLFPAQLAGLLGPAAWVSFGAVGAGLILVGLCFAEASSRFERPGGAYLYARAAFGDAVGFGVGWLSWASYVFGIAAVATGISAYLGYFSPALGSAGAAKAVAAASILAFGALNYRGVVLGARASNVFTVAKLLPLLALALFGLPRIEWARLWPMAPARWEGLGPACFLAYFALQGFEAVPVPSGEAANPKRDVPWAVTLSLVLASLLYMALQAVATSAVGPLAASQRPLADAAISLFGPVGAGLIALTAAFSMTGYVASAALVGPRYLSALAEDGHLPASLAEPHPRYAVPFRAIAVTTALSFASVLFFDFRRLVDFSNVAVCAQYLSTCAAVPVLRQRDAAGAWRLPGGWLVPAAGIAATLALGLQSSLTECGVSAALLAAGFALRKRCAKSGIREPAFQRA
ncbi:MAG TPA: APC family permease [Elusimicrobiota bacterium]|jgi:amino acid transporter|nr:APC family permease [Elusimicrobiota bacterium]